MKTRSTIIARLSTGLALCLACLGFCIATPTTVRAAQGITLTWQPSAEPDLLGYALYYGTNNGNYPFRIDVGTNLTATVSNLKEGATNYFAIAAYNLAGVEGPLSAPLTYSVPGILRVNPRTSPTGPLTLQFPVAPGHYYIVQTSTNLQTWTTLTQTATSTTNTWLQVQDPNASQFTKRFYRLVLH